MAPAGIQRAEVGVDGRGRAHETLTVGQRTRDPLVPLKGRLFVDGRLNSRPFVRERGPGAEHRPSAGNIRR